MQGFLVLNCIIGGQTLASVSSHLNDTLGIVIISVISLAVRLILLHPFVWCAERFVGDVLWLSVPSLVRIYRCVAKLAKACPQVREHCMATECHRFHCHASPWLPTAACKPSRGGPFSYSKISPVLCVYYRFEYY